MMASSTGGNNGLWWALAGIGLVFAARRVQAQRRKIDFRGKTIVITGGSRGLGLVLARQFAQEGASVAICARDTEELDAAIDDLRQYGTPVFAHACDLTDRNQVETFIMAAEEALGPVDVLVNNAGTIIVSPFEHTTEEDFRMAMDINFWAGFYTTEAVLPGMRQRRSGRIVNIASIGGKVPVPHLSPYVASKFAMVGYSETLRAEVMKDGIYVTTINPGLTRTGSPPNAYFKGQHEKEYAWFKTSDSLPLLTVSAEYSASRILDACRYGLAERTISLPYKLAVAFHGLFPGLTADLMTLANGLLPGPGGIGSRRKLGQESESEASRTLLTIPTDDSAEANNQQVGRKASQEKKTK